MDEHAVAARLRDGRHVDIRPISASDADALVRFHEQLTAETTRLRFFVTHPHLTAEEVWRFTHVDDRERAALVALDGVDIVAVGRYERLTGTDDAEVAFVVADAWQGLGIGTHLLDRLTRRARTQGITRLVADTLGENRRMRAVFRHANRITGFSTEAGVVHVVMNLDPEMVARPD